MSRRHPLSKDGWLEGNRQKFGIIFLLCMFAVMAGQAIFHFDPAPYLQFLTVLCGILIGGLSGSAIVQAYKVSSTSQTEEKTETLNENENISYVEKQVRPRDFQDFEEVENGS